MKKLMVLMLVLVSGFVFGQTKYVDELDGNNWMATPADTKYGFVVGFMNANRAALDAFYDKIDQQNQQAGYTGDVLKQKNNDASSRFEKFFIYNQGVNDIVNLLDNYYRDKENRNVYIWSAIIGLCGKELN